MLCAVCRARQFGKSLANRRILKWNIVDPVACNLPPACDPVATEIAIAIEYHQRPIHRRVAHGEDGQSRRRWLLECNRADGNRLAVHVAGHDHFPFLVPFRRKGINTELNSLLDDGQDVFKNFRYLFEGIPNRMKPIGFALELFGEIVRNRILDLRPNWVVT